MEGGFGTRLIRILAYRSRSALKSTYCTSVPFCAKSVEYAKIVLITQSLNRHTGDKKLIIFVGWLKPITAPLSLFPFVFLTFTFGFLGPLSPLYARFNRLLEFSKTIEQKQH